MSVKNWSSFYSKEGKQEIQQNILDTVSLWGAIGLLWYSFVSITGEHFPEFVQAMDGWMIGLFLVVLWLGYDWPSKYMKKWVTLCRLAGIVVPVGYIIVNFGRLLDGFYQMAEIYLPFVNSYYNTAFYLHQTLVYESAGIAFTALSMLLWWMAWLLAYGSKKRGVLGVFPLLALALELVVGLSPHGNGLWYLFFAVMVLAVMGGASLWKKGVVLAGVALSVLLTSVIFDENIQNLTTLETKQAVLDWQKNLRLTDFSLEKWMALDFHFDWEPLNNESPNYTGKTVLEIETNVPPASLVYLRGFYGTNYENGRWIYDDSALKKACTLAFQSEEEVAQAIFQMPVERYCQYHNLDISDVSEYVEEGIHFKINYTGTTGDVAYTTYGVDFSSLDEDYTLMGDYLLKKSIWDDSIEMNALNQGWNTTTMMTFINSAIDRGTFQIDVTNPLLSSYSTDGIDLSSQLAELKWINGLADAYLTVPADLDFASEALSGVEEWLEEDELEENSYIYGGFVVSNSENDNYRRLQYAEAVSTYLRMQMSYSLELDELPAGADPIEYALTESHEGYCMHFASAATLLLREAGVPARYVSGYAINHNAFAYDIETGTYKAAVTDYMAHTWVEIYLDYIGWIPIEVTPGSSLDALPTDEDIQSWEEKSTARRDQLTGETVTESESESESEEKEPESEDTSETATETESEAGNGSGNGQNGNDTNIVEWQKSLWTVVKVLGAVLLGGMLIWSLGILGKRSVHRYHAVLSAEMQKKLTRKSVKRMNRRIYHMLRIRNPKLWLTGKLSDVAYEKALAETFPEVSQEEWAGYMEIVKKNHYSYEEITTEEMQYCYECYKKIKLFNIS